MPLTKIVHTDEDGTVTVTHVDVPAPDPTPEERLAVALDELVARLSTAADVPAVRAAAAAAAAHLPPGRDR